MDVLVLPMAVEALWLRQTARCVGPLCDPSALPWVDGRTGHDRNPDAAWTADTITTPPFESRGSLEAGVHLHWILPRALRRASHPLDPMTGKRRLDQMAFPRAPDRWLVRRIRSEKVEARWLVESDHVWRLDLQPPPGTISALLPSWSRRDSGAPSRFLGKVHRLPGDELPPTGPSWESLTGLPLTTLGPWEEGSFATVYPNCRSIFGLWDPDPGEGEVSYQVVGGYADPDRDVVAELLARARRDAAHDLRGAGAIIREWFDEDLGPVDPGRLDGCRRLACSGAISLSAESTAVPHSALVSAAVGQSPDEALAALIAKELDGRLPGDADVAEACLLALRQAPVLDGVQLDLGPRLAQALHQQGFVPVDGGRRWQVIRRGEATAATETDGSTELTLPNAAAHALEALNRAQAAADNALRELARTAEVLGADHARSMLATARPLDRPQDMPDLDQATEHLANEAGRMGELTQGLRDARTRVGTLDEPGPELRAVLAIIQAHNEQLDGETPWQLVVVPGARFWRPRDPSVLMEGDLLRPSPLFHGDVPPARVVSMGGWDLRDDALRPADAPASEDDHHPALLEWKAELLPARAARHVAPAARRYDPRWLLDTYTLGQADQAFLTADPGVDALPAGLVIAGRTVLVPNAVDVMGHDIEAWLDRWLRSRQAALPADWTPDPESGAPGGPYNKLVDRFAGRYSDALLRWVSAPRGTEAPAHVATVLLEAWSILDDRQPRLLGQDLVGFHRALLGLRDGLPLETADPQGFPEYRAVSRAVAEALEGASVLTGSGARPRTTPLTYGEFAPLRAGDLRLLGLRVIDTFGRATDLRWTSLARPAALRGSFEDRMALPPRYSQPARLSFRWLTADAFDATGLRDAESTEHPAASPICGWLVGDNVDGSVLVFDQAGDALGSVEPPGVWRLPPGDSAGALRPEDIPNDGLRRVACWLVEGARTPGFLDAVLDALEAALEAIEPEDVHQHTARALLSTRPVAVVRARVGLELHGGPATDQGWHAFRATLDGAPPSTRGFEDVAIPIRVGEHGMLNDGVVGYFLEDDDGSLLDGRLLCPQGLWADGGARDARIVPFAPGDPALQLQIAPSEPDRFLTVLLDPRGAMHLTSGVLPTRILTVPADQVRPSLERIAVWFRAMPVLSGPGDLELGLPDEAGERWEWRARTPEGWEILAPRAPSSDEPGDQGPCIVPPPPGPTTDATIAREGWLRLDPQPGQKEP